MFNKLACCLVLLQIGFLVTAALAAEQGRKILPGHVPAAIGRLAPLGRLPAENNLPLAIGLPLRDPAGLSEFLRQVQDPHSTNFHKYLTPQEFAARFGPTEAQYAAVCQFAATNGFTITGTHSNRLVLDVDGSISNIGRAFQINLRTYQHPTESRTFFAPDAEPSVPEKLPVIDIEGLTDLSPPRPLLRPARPATTPLSGSGPSGYYAGNDFRNAYVPGTTLRGAGQTVGLVEFSSYYQADITKYESLIGLATNVPLSNVVIGRRSPSTANNSEVALDIEVAIAMAPGLAKVIVYETSGSASSMLSKIASDNLAKQIGCSWSWGGGPGTTIDNTLQQMAAQGQSFFQASGDSDAYTGNNLLDNPNAALAPVDSTNVTCVGGTTLTMNGAGVSYASETTWNWNYLGGSDANVGSGGGISGYYTIPPWQAGISMAANSGSTLWRNVPDVALTADQVFVDYNNGSSGGFGGTSCAAPLWAGFCALVNQASTLAGGSTVGFLNPALYALAAGPDYTNCFHDVTTGSNIGTGTPGLFNAVAGYDLCTGLGTPNGIHLINALVPFPSITSPPVSQFAPNGSTVQFSVAAAGQSPLSYQWLFNGTVLADGLNIFGTTSNILTLSSVTSNNDGNFTVVVTNSSGSVTSSVAVLTVGFPPLISVQPTNLTVLSGSNATFATTVDGSAPLAFQWRQNGNPLANGGGISGATSNVLTRVGVTTSNAGAYTLAVTNLFGAAVSATATLTVVAPPSFTGSFSNRSVQCGTNNVAFSITPSGTAPVYIQWSLDGTPIGGATSTAFALTNLHLPNHTISVLITNLYGSITSNVLVTVADTLPPAIALLGSNPVYIELGGAFTDPGATANDLCMGVVPVATAGTVNTAAVGTNSIAYLATDGNGNSNSVMRLVIVRDTTPPAILYSFTNLVLIADSNNCGAALPDLTGTNYILATDLSGSANISQDPIHGALLPIGTNQVVLQAADTNGNSAFSTNTVVVVDQTPPAFSTQPLSQTNFVGDTATFFINVSACTPLALQWFFHDSPLSGETNTTLVRSNLNTDLAGPYFAIASAAGGSSTSQVAVLTVNLLPTALALASSGNPSGYNDAIQFLATITPADATGSVQFYTNDVLLSAGSLSAATAASLACSDLPRATNLITAVYAGDATHLPATNTLAQVVTNHPPVAAPFFTNCTAGSILEIPISTLSSNWSDLDGDLVSLVAVAVSTNGVNVTNDSGNLVYSSPNNQSDAFACTISDGWGGTNYQQVFIAVSGPSLIGAAATLSVTYGPGDALLIILHGTAGASYVLDSALDPTSPAAWLPLATNSLDTNGQWQFPDRATNSALFYRARSAP